jgi:Na+-driven multidrug efflux pump
VLLNIAGVLLLRYISMLEHSAAAQAAYTICYAQLFALVTWTSFGLRAASGTLMGQNMGAGNAARGKQCVIIAAGLGALWALCIGFLFWTMPYALLRLFNATDQPIVGLGMSLLRYLSISGIALSITLALTGGMQGAGATRAPMFIAFITQIVVLLSFCQLLFSWGLLTAYNIWMAILISHLLRLMLTCLAFRRKGWIHTRVELKGRIT